MPRSRPLPRVAALAVVVLAAAGCGTSPTDEPDPPTTDVRAAAGSGFCLAWGRYEDALARWLRSPPTSVEEAEEIAAAGRRAAQEARSVAPEGLESSLALLVEAHDDLVEAIDDAEALTDATNVAIVVLASPDATAARRAAQSWVADTC